MTTAGPRIDAIDQPNVRVSEGAGTTTLAYNTSGTGDCLGQIFNLSAARTCVLPSASISAGQKVYIQNVGAFLLTVQSSNGNVLATVQGTQFVATALVATPTTAAHWAISNPGERINGTIVNGANVNNTNAQAASIVLPIGAYAVHRKLHIGNTGGDGTTEIYNRSEISTVTATLPGGETYSVHPCNKTQTGNEGTRMFVAPSHLVVTATTTYFLNVRQVSGGTAYSTAAMGADTLFYAIRLN